MLSKQRGRVRRAPAMGTFWGVGTLLQGDDKNAGALFCPPVHPCLCFILDTGGEPRQCRGCGSGAGGGHDVMSHVTTPGAVRAHNGSVSKYLCPTFLSLQKSPGWLLIDNDLTMRSESLEIP